jgi:mRNA-degrading endonuclease HigB of HigAB toxin-antitoxin module
VYSKAVESCSTSQAKYRLVVAIDYERQTCFVKFIGTHEQDDRIDAETVPQ